MSPLDMARTAHMRLPSLPSTSKRQLLSLLLARCSWAHGRIAAAFKTPFNALANLANLADRDRAVEENSDAVAALAELLLRPDAETRLLIARHNAMMQLRDGKARSDAGWDQLLPAYHSLAA